MPRRLTGYTDHVHIIVNRVLRGFLWGLKQGAYIDIKADIGKGSGDHFSASVMAILPHLYHQHTRAPTFFLGKGFYIPLNGGKAFVILIGFAIDAGKVLTRRDGGRIFSPLPY